MIFVSGCSPEIIVFLFFSLFFKQYSFLYISILHFVGFLSLHVHCNRNEKHRGQKDQDLY